MQRLQQQRLSLDSAINLHDSLESIDLLDLAATGAVLYDLLTEKEEEKLGFLFTGQDHTRQQREIAVKYNLELLHKKYASYSEIQGIADIRTFLIRFYWLSYFQVAPETRGKDLNLNWGYFRKWLKNIYAKTNGFSN